MVMYLLGIQIQKSKIDSNSSCNVKKLHRLMGWLGQQVSGQPHFTSANKTNRNATWRTKVNYALLYTVSALGPFTRLQICLAI